jgi:hypothetical protein
VDFEDDEKELRRKAELTKNNMTADNFKKLKNINQN